jgi:hypothetical protein
MGCQPMAHFHLQSRLSVASTAHPMHLASPGFPLLSGSLSNGYHYGAAYNALKTVHCNNYKKKQRPFWGRCLIRLVFQRNNFPGIQRS